MFIGYGYAPPVLGPIYGPPVPRMIAWGCTKCDVGWKSFDRECWCCGSTAHVAEYGSVSALEAAVAAAQAHLSSIA